MPAETAAVGKVILNENSPYRLIGNRLFDRYRQDDYADLYSVEGKPGILPVTLAFVTVSPIYGALARPASGREFAHAHGLEICLAPAVSI
jgi:hypothetical protein